MLTFLLIQIFLGNGNLLQPEECQLIKVSSLERDLVVLHVEEPTAVQARRIAPLKDRPLSRFMDPLRYADYLRTLEIGFEQFLIAALPFSGAVMT